MTIPITTFSIYVHYPFCIKRCSYCGFAAEVEKEDLAADYRRALLMELQRRLEEPAWRDGQIETLYFGGGTPSLMPPEFVERFINTLDGKWRPFELPPIPPNAQNLTLKTHYPEITLEANPKTRDVESFAAFRRAGVNRLSLGAQSFVPEELSLLGRAHSVEEIYDAVRIAREAGFNNLSLDLIYGVPGQTVESFRRSVMEALNLGVDHLSCYTLSIEEGTPFHRAALDKRFPTPDPDMMADQYAMLIELVCSIGFIHYELTNYAKPGFQCCHNQVYWRRTPYLGIGAGAHSFDGRRRFWNRRDARAHITAVECRGDFFEGEEILTCENEREEELYLALRTTRGLTDQQAASYCDPLALKEMEDGGYIIWEEGVWRMNEKKWLMLDEVVLRLMRKSDDSSALI